MRQEPLIDPSMVGKQCITATCPPGVAPGQICFGWPTAVRQIWKRPELLPPSVWAEKYRIIDVGSRPGPWSNDTARYLCGPMDVFFLPFIREIVIVAPQQTGKTEVMLNCLAALIDQAAGPVLMVYDQQEIAKRMCTTRVKNMMRLSPRLKKYLTGKADDFANFQITLKHMSIPFAWATSVSQLSNQPIKYLLLDEVDQYDATNKTTSGPVSQARKRTRSYHRTSKIMLASSPTVEEGEISVAYNRVQAQFEYAVICPEPLCNHAHVMAFTGQHGSGVVWPKDARDPEIIQSQRLAEYVCPGCGQVWDDYKRDMAVRKGFWRDKQTQMELISYCKRYRPRSVGFQYSTLVSPFVSLSETAAKFVLAQKDLKIGRIDAYKDWLNGYMAEIWKEDFSPRKEAAVLELRDERPAGVLPDINRVAALVATADTQDNGFWYELRAWGYGQEAESWQVRCGFVESLEALDSVFWIPYPDINNHPCHVDLAGIDSQGHRTREVYDWCIANRGRAIPLAGERTMRQPYKMSNLEVWPGTDTRIPGGLKLLHIHTKHYKDSLHRKLAIGPADPGAWHMNSECTEDWARQMCAEYVDDNQVWVCPKGRANHAWDVSVYNFCLADFLGTRYMQPSEDMEDEVDHMPDPPPRRRKRW